MALVQSIRAPSLDDNRSYCWVNWGRVEGPEDKNRLRAFEERNSEELSHVEGLDKKGNIEKVQIYPKKSKAMNLAFDVTPAKYVTGLITEKGICEASEKGLTDLFK